MWLAIDIGGTKTLLAVFTESGELKEDLKFPTDRNYRQFIENLKENVAKLEHKSFKLACSAAPGRIDQQNGHLLGTGNLPWREEPLRADLEAIVGCPVILENDAKLAALSEARALGRGKYHKVLYITISTGIGGGVIIDDIIDPDWAMTEIGQMMFEFNGEVQKWESFASGSAIVKRFNMRASEITDPAVWDIISHDIALGLIDAIAVIQPDIVVVGGGVGSHFDRFGAKVAKELKKYETALVPVPPLIKAKKPEEAVIYGCLELLRDHGRSAS